DYKHLLADLNSKVTVHGPFMDMVSGSPDPRINAVCVARYSHAIRLAAAVGSKRIIFHANFIGSLHNAFYRDGWHDRNVAFWKPLADYADDHDVTILLENMWEFDPTIITDVLEDVNHPRLRACLDVGHAHVFSDNDFDFNTWLTKMQPWVDEFHMNNNNGILDEHHGFDFERGVLDYHDLLPRIQGMYPDADIVLEMDSVADMRRSLSYFGIDATEDNLRVHETSA
ncbi:MAG: sugar phosphate isomerase/epimerase family protein, partial [Aggregatilineales bacterium]